MIHCIIVDDEPLARDILIEYTSKFSFLHLVAECKNAYEASAALQEYKIDLMFLDIQMPDISGMKLLDTLEHKPYVIFTTAYSDYAVEGFEKNAVDYLLKPISPERFLQAVTKVHDLQSLHAHAKPEERNYMFVKVEYQTVRVNFNDILYIEGLKDYVKIYTNQGMIMTLLNIKGILAKLPEHQFVRVHKSYIVSLSAIEKIERNRIIFGTKRIPVGDTYKDVFNARINNEI
ncbi:MAG: LytTR family DNA-binding domain-containing protein [Bacteroidales bacterium]|jgi:two-component system LytT family response regulator|nr:LytTR family DNA-binding domain-containing protein [Bacteroidales bacterium]